MAIKQQMTQDELFALVEEAEEQLRDADGEEAATLEATISKLQAELQSHRVKWTAAQLHALVEEAEAQLNDTANDESQDDEKIATLEAHIEDLQAKLRSLSQ